MSAPIDPAADRRPLISPRFTGKLLQTVFLGIFLFGTVIVAVVSPETVSSARFIGGAGLIVVATALPYLAGFTNWGFQPWTMLLPALDFIAIAIIRSEGAGGVTNPLVLSLALPAIWVGLLRSRGALWAFAPLPFLVIVPDIVRISTGVLDDAAADRATVLVPIFPILMIITALIAYVMATTLAERQAVLDREHEQRLRTAVEGERTRQLLDAVVDSLDVGVIVLSPDNDLVLMNRRLRESPELSGGGSDPWESLQRVKAFAMDRITPIPEEESTLARVSRGEEVKDRLLWVGPPGAEQTALTVSANAVTDADGALIARVIVVKDVTDFVRALEAKDVFIATVSHELRTPLTTIAGFVELIEEHSDALGPETREWLSVIERNVRRQQVVVRDLLTAASSRSTPIVLDRVEADLADVVKDAAIALAREADEKNLVLTVLGMPAPGRFDPLRMAQVAENLLSNAVRYTPPGGAVTIESRVDGDRLELSVRDNGTGISDEDRERLFDQFFRSASARASAIRGVGLGLPVVRALVTAHDGTIDIDSELGEGTTVTVRIPSRASGRSGARAT